MAMLGSIPIITIPYIICIRCAVCVSPQIGNGRLTPSMCFVLFKAEKPMPNEGYAPNNNYVSAVLRY